MTVDDLFALGAAYDIWAAITKRPTITGFCRRHRWFAIPVLIVTAGHLLRKIEETL